jgi:glutaredoxin
MRLGYAAVALGLLLAMGPGVRARASACGRIEVFTREGCVHCSRAAEFLAELQRTHPDLEIRALDVEREPGALEQLRALAAQHGVRAGVPAFSICGEFRVGFDGAETTGRAIEAALAGPARAPATLALPWLGEVGPGSIGLPLFTVLVGLVDGLNPCALWVLLILLSVLVGVRDRRKLVLVAGVFVGVSGLAYFAFMAAWLNVFLWIGWSRQLQLGLASLALVLALLHAKDAFGLHALPSLRIPLEARPRLFARMRAIVQAPSLWVALVSAFGLALVVNALELLCTAGLPALYTQILTLHALRPGQYYGYLALYNAAYILDDSLLVGAAVLSLRRFKLQERQGRWLKALSAAIMGMLAVLLLLRPAWLAP